MTKTGTGSVCPETVQYHLEIPLPARVLGRVLLCGAEAAPDHGHVVDAEVGANHAGALPARDQLANHPEQLALVACDLAHHIGPGAVYLALGPVAAVHARAAPHEVAERRPRVVPVLERVAGDATQLLVAAQRARLDERLLRGEVPVHRADPYPGARGHVINLGVEPVLRKRLTRGGANALRVAAGVGSQRTCDGWMQTEPRLRYSAKAESEFRILPGSSLVLPPHLPYVAGTQCRVRGRPAPLDRPDPALRRPVRGRARRVDRERRAALDREGPELLGGEPPVGRERLRTRVRRLPAARRAHGRPARAPARVHGRARAVRDRLAGGRARHVGGLPDRRARGSGA